MKPPVFDYFAPTTVDETHRGLAEHQADGKILAGGQSLVPVLNMRLAYPAVLIDINRVSELDHITLDNGRLTIGALTRQQTLLESDVVAEHFPLLAEATRYIGHRTIRNRGTVGGSLAHADPAAELPAVMLALNAELTLSSTRGQRQVPAQDFFVDYMTTALNPDELLQAVQIPTPAPRSGWSFKEVSRRHGDFALVATAALVTLDEAGTCTDARLVLTGVGPTPVTVDLSTTLIGAVPTADAVAAAADAAREAVDPPSDVHATSDYRRHLARVLSRRALTTAIERAGGRV